MIKNFIGLTFCVAAHAEIDSSFYKTFIGLTFCIAVHAENLHDPIILTTAHRLKQEIKKKKA